MKRFILLLLPIFAGLLVFSVSLFILSKTNKGNGALQITSSPAAQVYLNGALLGKTPLCRCEGKDMIPSGDYTLRLVPVAGDNLFPYEEHIAITKGVLTVVERIFGVGEYASGSIISLVPLSNSSSSQIFVESFPSGSSVHLDGNFAGQTPLLIKSTTPSDHDIALSINGYKDKTIHVHTAPGYQLRAIVTLGLLSQNATSEAALSQPTPTQLVKPKVLILDTGTGFLRVRSDPTLSASETARVKPGQTFNFLAEQEGWYEIQLTDGSSGWINAQYAKKQ